MKYEIFTFELDSYSPYKLTESVKFTQKNFFLKKKNQLYILG